MIKFENDCCDCALHCRGSTCRNRNVPHFYCDECEDEVEELFEYDGEVDLGNATTDEVAQVAWMNREQIKELFEHNMFVETLEYFFMEVDKERR